jgi:hypothetical protein
VAIIPSFTNKVILKLDKSLLALLFEKNYKIYSIVYSINGSYCINECTKLFKQHELIIAVGNNLETNNDLVISVENKQKQYNDDYIYSH